MTYTVADRELRIDYHAVTDAPTHVNLTQHSYFNLRGTGDVLSHCLAINASTYLPVDETLIPTGEFAPVANSPFDFQESTAIGLRLHADHEQLSARGGYDHNFNINASVRRWRLRPGSSSHRAGARSNCARRNRECSSIQARPWAIAASVSSRSIFPIRPTVRSSPRRCFGRESAISRRRCMRSAGSW